MQRNLSANEQAMPRSPSTSILTSKPEAKSFLRTALAWHGSATPRVLPRILAAAAYSAIIVLLVREYPALSTEITPFEFCGAALGVLLVVRLNSGLDRWWEARKIWGSIVNQSRNLAVIGTGYADADCAAADELLKWTAAWPHVMRESLREETTLHDVEPILGLPETAQIRAAQHMPTYVATRIIKILRELRTLGLDDFAFQRAERERALLIDAIGACERIRSTPIPLAVAINTRRLILLFLALLPLGLVDRLGWLTPFVMAAASYPLFSLDEIGVALQNPFLVGNLSHLPLMPICQNIQANVLSLRNVAVVNMATNDFQPNLH
ncbi:MAG TPA: bestrophin family ion channel [Pirellulales bacterium]|nr:bestrophin family ion channel [Pirellulales bacterium]